MVGVFGLGNGGNVCVRVYECVDINQCQVGLGCTPPPPPPTGNAFNLHSLLLLLSSPPTPLPHCRFSMLWQESCCVPTTTLIFTHMSTHVHICTHVHRALFSAPAWFEGDRRVLREGVWGCGIVCCVCICVLPPRQLLACFILLPVYTGTGECLEPLWHHRDQHPPHTRIDIHK